MKGSLVGHVWVLYVEGIIEVVVAGVMQLADVVNDVVLVAEYGKA